MRLKENLVIKKEHPKDKIFCHEEYAANAYAMYSSNSSFFIKKDLSAGELVSITGVSSVSRNEIYFEVNNTTNVPIDMNKEKRFLELHGVNLKEFLSWMNTKEGKKEFISRNHQILITESTPNLKASLIGGYAEKMKTELYEQIKNPKTAYEAKVIGKNQGGFIVDVCGVQSFLPGGLAAANKINDFDAYIGNNITVMVEDFLSDIQTFIVSHKKYLNYILPSLIEQHDWTQQHTGIVTGCNKYGVFVEFYEQFTGLLHVSKMTPEIKEKFNKRQLKTGQELTCWIREITKNHRLVLTNYEPGTEEDQVKVDEIYKGRVTGIQDYGVFIKLKSGESGLIPRNFLYRAYEMGENVTVKVSSIKEDKIYFIEEDELLTNIQNEDK